MNRSDMISTLEPDDSDRYYIFRVAVQFFRVLLLSVLILVVSALITEIVLRKKGFKPLTIENGLSATVPDSYTGWRMRPNVRTGPEYVLTNQYGLHANRDITLQPKPGETRVGVLGSSVVWGLGLNLADTIPEGIHQQLLKKYNIRNDAELG